jgi:hypothetical protein
MIDASTTVTSFDEPIEVTLSYEDGDIDGIDESSLWIYRYDGSNWNALNNCVVDQVNNQVTCETNNFSDFALFGEEEEEGEEETRTTSSGRSGTTLEGRIRNLVSIGKTKEAEELQRQYEQMKMINMASTTTNQVSTTSRFIFTRTLWPQTTHPDVKELQKFLNRKGFIVSSIGPGSSGNETDYFGVKTQLALIKYQESKKVEILDRAGLTKGTGVFGPITMGVVNGE